MAASPRPMPRRWRRILWWGLGATLAVSAWVGWQAYDYESAVREAKEAGLGWEVSDTHVTFNGFPKSWEEIGWRVTAFRQRWNKRTQLAVQTASDLSSHRRLIHRLNPTHVRLMEGGDLSVLQGLGKLEELEIWGAKDLRDFGGLRKLPKVKKVGIQFCDTLQDLSGLGDLPALQWIDIRNCAALKSTRGIHDLPSLQLIVIDECPGLRELPALKSFPQLLKVAIRDSGLPDLHDFQGLSKLESLDIGTCPGIRNLNGLSGLTQLQELGINACANLETLAGLEGAVSLERVDIMNCFKLRDFEALRGVSKLNTCYLSGCPLLQDLDVLAGLTELHTLGLSECEGLRNLEMLGKFTQLREVDLRDFANASPATMEALYMALPKTRFYAPDGTTREPAQ